MGLLEVCWKASLIPAVFVPSGSAPEKIPDLGSDQ